VSFPVVFRPQAEAEFEEAQAWYEERLRGLGHEFVTSVQATINLVSRNPGQFQRIEGEVRRALVRRFPYAIFYLADPESVVIIAVFHTSRDPTIWRQRAR
jgi:toxin ParE1/3/4